jgi:hypothetical protein
MHIVSHCHFFYLFLKRLVKYFLDSPLFLTKFPPSRIIELLRVTFDNPSNNNLSKYQLDLNILYPFVYMHHNKTSTTCYKNKID